jgi:hypothetical protein
MKDCQQATRGSDQSLQPLHTPLVPLHAFLKQRQSSRLTNPHQGFHLALQHTQISYYNSLAPYRAHQPTLYAVRCGGALLLRFVDHDGSSLILRPYSRAFPVQLLPLSTKTSPADHLVGRVCLVVSEL